MKSLQALLPVAVALAVACIMASAGSCTQPPAPQLVRVLDATPREIEVGDKIEIVGDGFPAGKPARVTFRGVLNRPAERPVRSAEIVLAGTARSSTQVEVPFAEATEALFCGPG